MNANHTHTDEDRKSGLSGVVRFLGLLVLLVLVAAMAFAVGANRVKIFPDNSLGGDRTAAAADPTSTPTLTATAGPTPTPEVFWMVVDSIGADGSFTSKPTNVRPLNAEDCPAGSKAFEGEVMTAIYYDCPPTSEQLAAFNGAIARMSATATPTATRRAATTTVVPSATPLIIEATVPDGQFVTREELTVALANAIATAKAEPQSAVPSATPVIIKVESSNANPSAVTIDKVEMVTGNALATPPTLLTEEMINEWSTKWYAGATDQMNGQGAIPWSEFPALHPSTATIFPNTDNPLSGFIAAHGLEYGEDESQHCGSIDDLCSIVIPPMSYVLMSGNSQNDLGSCLGAEGAGCAWMFTNVGLSSFELKGWFDNVFIIQGRYWHGDFLPEAIVEGLSHVSWNMTNGDSQLNPNGIQNAGGNCSSPGGCEAVINQFFVTSGAELLIYGTTTYQP